MFSRRRFLGAGLAAFPVLSALPGLSHVPRPSDEWEDIRALYVLPEDRTYLNTGGLGPTPRPVLDTYLDAVRQWQGQTETGHARIEAARAPVAAFLGAKDTEICFTRNATEGNAIVASGLRLETGDEVIVDAHAHPGGAIAWLNRQKQDGAKVRIFEPDGATPHDILERIEAQITDRTRVIAVSHVTAPTGIVLPIREIAALASSRNIWLHVDGAQSVGMLPIDLHTLGCQSWATSGHKWLGAPHGTGILYISESRLDDVVPTEIGAYSEAGYHLPDSLDYLATARRHESGTRSAALVEATAAAVSFMAGIGMERVQARGKELCGLLRARIEDADVDILTPEHDALHGSMLTVRPRSQAFDAMYRRLSRKHSLRCRIVTERDLNAVRFSLHVFNSAAEVDVIANAINSGP